MKDSSFKYLIFLLALSFKSHALTYEQALDLAVGYDKKYASAIIDQKSSEYLSTIAKSALIANVQLSGFQASNRLNMSQPNSSGGILTSNLNYTSQNYTAQLTQPLFNLAAIFNFIQSNKQEAAAISRLENAFNELSIQTASAFYAFGAAKEGLLYSNKEYEALEHQERIVAARVMAGLSSKVDLVEISYSKMQAQANVDESNNALVASIATLEKLIGRQVSPNEPVVAVFDGVIVDKPVEYFIDSGKINNPKVIFQQLQYESSLYEFKKVRAGSAPTLDFIAQQGYQKSNTLSTINQKSLQTYTGLQLNIPIFDGGRLYGKDRQSAMYAESQRILVDSEINDLEESIRKNYSATVSAIAGCRALEAQIRSARFLVAATERQRTLGLKSTYDVLVAIRKLYHSQKELSRIKYSGALAAKSLVISSGLLKFDRID